MTLKATYDTAEDVPPALRDHYVLQDDGRWTLQIEGSAAETDPPPLPGDLTYEAGDGAPGSDPEEDRLRALEDALEQSRTLLRKAGEDRLKAAVLEACGRAGVRDLSRADVVRAARERFAVTDDLEVVPVEEGSADSIDNWLSDTRRAAETAWWEVPAGAGTPPARAPLLPANPFSTDSLNLTEQGRLMRDNPDLARRLREQAG